MYSGFINLNLDILGIIKITFTLVIKTKRKKLDKNTIPVLTIITLNGKYYVFYNSI